MMNFNRRKFAGRLMSAFSALGIGSAILGKSAFGQTSDSEVKKLNYEGKPADGTQMITSLIVHNGLIYISVQGADIETHTTKVMNNVKKLVEAGGGSMDTILQLTVYLANLADYDGMNKVFKTYFPHGGPARTTISVAGVPGHSLLEINCIAAVAHK